MTVDDHRIGILTLRWTARVISTLAVSFWLLILLDIVACEVLIGYVCITWETALLFFFVAVSFLVLILSWRWEGFGGLIMTIWGIVFSIIAAMSDGSYRAVSILVSGVPFLIAGILFLISWQLSQRKIASR